LGQNNLSSYLFPNKTYSATDYMLETVSFVYCLLFIYTFYLYQLASGLRELARGPAPLDVSRNNILLNSQNNDTTISTKLMDTQSAEN
jgi:hypothetical protein